MVSTLTYLVQLFVCLIVGMILAKTCIVPKKAEPAVDKLLSICLYALLFTMGVRTGQIDDLFSQAGRMTLLAVGFGISVTIGSAAAVIGASVVMKKLFTAQGGNGTESKGGIKKLHFREPLRLVFSACLGFVFAVWTPLLFWFDDRITTWLLFLLLLLVGIQMVQGKTDMVSVFKNPISMVLPLLTIVGTLAAGACIGRAFGLSVGVSLAMASGFGWYSLSGILIAEMGSPVLGSAAFLSNLLREILACVTIPLLAGLKKPHAAISVGGATSMDVTLPIVEHSCGIEYVPLSLAHGILLTILVPFFVPFFYMM